MQKRGKENFNAKKYYWIPKIDKISKLKWINPIIKYSRLKKKLSLNNIEYLFLTFPDQIDVIPKKFTGKILYDCMDNHIEFIEDAKEKKLMKEKELKIITKSDVIFVTSRELKKVLIRRYGVEIKDKIYLVRNGYSGETLSINNSVNNNICKEKFKLSYFGTISHWFNFDFIERSLDDIENIEYDLMGPVEIEIPKKDGINYLGTIEHKNLYEVTKKSDCYIMPFKLNSIIESVDPVKLYEYINFNKNILTIQYEEVERFGPFVHFYTDYESYIIAIKKMMENNKLKYTSEERDSFLENNKWGDRVAQIINIIES